MPDSPARQSWLNTLGWAAYLACSWTWCIGMFLPVLLVRDYGIWGFVFFAAPNVLGAAAMGWVLKDGVSERIVATHTGARTAFVLVTLLFHFYCGYAIMGRLSGEGFEQLRQAQPLWPVLTGVLFFVALVATRRFRSLAVALWGTSTAIAIALYLRGQFHLPSIADPVSAPPKGLPLLAPVCAFGFALCPYLDNTFHVTRQAGLRQARIAFGLGFSVLFLVMILMTLGYAHAFLAGTDLAGSFAKSGLVPIVSLHMVLQGFFTIAALRIAEPSPRSGLSRSRLASVRGSWTELLVFLAIIFAPRILDELASVLPRPAGMSGFEVVYRLFMSAYGLFFPAYVWLLMIPTRDGHAGTAGPSGRRKLLIWAFACGVAAPMFWMGFIERQEVWLGPGLGVVLAARLSLPRKARAIQGDGRGTERSA